MKTLTGSDSSILAYIASAQEIPEEEFKRLFSQLSEDAREIASAVLELKGRRNLSGHARPRSSAPARRTAKALMAWA